MGDKKLKAENHLKQHEVHFETRERAHLTAHLLQMTGADGRPVRAKDRAELKLYEEVFGALELDHFAERLESPEGLPVTWFRDHEIRVFTITGAMVDYLLGVFDKAMPTGFRALALIPVLRRLEDVKVGTYNGYQPGPKPTAEPPATEEGTES